MAVMVPDEFQKNYWLVVRFCIAESGVNCRPAHCLFLCPTTKLAREKVVQSLNSPFFPPHIGAEPGRAKEESRITCMRMLRANQSKITASQPRCSRHCVAQCLSQLAL